MERCDRRSLAVGVLGGAIESKVMAEAELLRLLKRSVEEWNDWRAENPEVAINLQEANLLGANLEGVNLEGGEFVKLYPFLT